MRDADAVAQLERLLEEVETIGDARARETALAAVQGVVELYGSGLERIVAMLSERDDASELADALTADELVSHLLLLHDLHPVPVEARVRAALDDVRPYLDSHGGGVELLGVGEGVVRLRMEGTCNGCPSSTTTLKLAIEDAIRKAAPEVETIEADGVEGLEVPNGNWVSIDGVGSLADGATTVRDGVLFIRLADRLYAYRSTCAACGAPLAGALLTQGCVGCSACGARYDVRHAGRSDGAHLQPVPLLEDDGAVRVALA